MLDVKARWLSNLTLDLEGTSLLFWRWDRIVRFASRPLGNGDVIVLCMYNIHFDILSSHLLDIARFLIPASDPKLEKNTGVVTQKVGLKNWTQTPPEQWECAGLLCLEVWLVAKTPREAYKVPPRAVNHGAKDTLDTFYLSLDEFDGVFPLMEDPNPLKFTRGIHPPSPTSKTYSSSLNRLPSTTHHLIHHSFSKASYHSRQEAGEVCILQQWSSSPRTSWWFCLDACPTWRWKVVCVYTLNPKISLSFLEIRLSKLK